MNVRRSERTCLFTQHRRTNRAAVIQRLPSVRVGRPGGALRRRAAWQAQAHAVS